MATVVFLLGIVRGAYLSERELRDVFFFLLDDAGELAGRVAADSNHQYAMRQRIERSRVSNLLNAGDAPDFVNDVVRGGAFGLVDGEDRIHE